MVLSYAVCLGCSLVVFVAGFSGVLLPYWIGWQWGGDVANVEGMRAWLSRANLFGGGAMLALCLMHLIPHALAMSNQSSSVWIFVVASFLVVLACDKVLRCGHGHSHGPLPEALPESTRGSDSVMKSGVTSPTNPCLHVELTSFDHRQRSNTSTSPNAPRDTPTTVIIPSPTTASFQASSSASILLVVISLHALFEGIAVATAATSTAAWVITLVLSAHKLPEALVVSMAFAKTNVPLAESLPVLTVYSCGTPLGIVFGSVLSPMGVGFLEAPLICIAAGSLLYISCCEIIPEEFTEVLAAETNVAKVLSFCCGAVLVWMLSAAEEYAHHLVH